MFNRRHLLALVAASALTAGAQAQTAPSELVFAVVPAENAGQVADRYKDFLEYLSKETGVKVTLRIASDYAAVIEGQRAEIVQELPSTASGDISTAPVPSPSPRSTQRFSPSPKGWPPST